jgi:uncharacterized membrane protein YGL010W
MSVKNQVERMLEEYQRDHTHPMNKATHMIGIPMIIVSLGFMFFNPIIGISLFVLGWVFQFIGHAFEGKPPTFFRDPKFLLIGATWYMKRAYCFVTGQPMTQPKPEAEVEQAPETTNEEQAVQVA